VDARARNASGGREDRLELRVVMRVLRVVMRVLRRGRERDRGRVFSGTWVDDDVGIRRGGAEQKGPAAVWRAKCMPRAVSNHCPMQEAMSAAVAALRIRGAESVHC
jgi:hypothetical protein